MICIHFEGELMLKIYWISQTLFEDVYFVSKLDD